MKSNIDCSSFISLSDTPFANCSLSPEDYVGDCEFDWCVGQDIALLCEDISDFAIDCQANGDEIGDWRSLVPGCGKPLCNRLRQIQIYYRVSQKKKCTQAF